MSLAITARAIGLVLISFAIRAGAINLEGAESKPVTFLIQSGKSLMEKKQWEKAIAVFTEANKQHSKRHRNEKAEAAYLVGICLEEIEKTHQAKAAYLAVVSTYTNEVEWSSLALERQFQLLFPSKETSNSIAAYRFLRRNTYVIEFIIEARHDETKSPDALIRLLNLLKKLTIQLQLTGGQISQIGQDLDIPK